MAGKRGSELSRGNHVTHYRGSEHPNWRGGEARLTTLHQWLNANFPKTGICDQCSTSGKTHFALIHGCEYSRRREDYREMCVRCHNAYDHESHQGEKNGAAKLTEDSVRDLRLRRSLGETLTALAREHDVTRQAVSYAVQGVTWGWVI